MMSRSITAALLACTVAFRVRSPSKVRAQHKKVLRTGRMRIAGHRGSSATAPENTLQANALALEQGADGVEFDVLRSAEGELFLLHDYTLEKRASKICPPILCSDGGLTQAEYLEKLTQQVTELSYWDFLRHVDIGAWKGAAYAGITPPLLLDAMAAIPDGKFALVELKGGAEDLVQAAVSMAEEQQWAADKMHLISFNISAMAYAKQLLEKRGMDNPVWFVKGASSVAGCLADVQAAHEARLDGVDFVANPLFVTKKVVTEADRLGLEVAVWVSSKLPFNDSPENAKWMENNGVDIFTSDLGRRMQKFIRSRD